MYNLLCYRGSEQVSLKNGGNEGGDIYDSMVICLYILVFYTYSDKCSNESGI